MQIGNYDQDNNSFNQGFFILNKIDNIINDTEEEIVKNFKEIFKEINTKKGKIKIPFKEDNATKYNEFIAISAKKLLKEEGPFINNIIEDIIQKARNSEFNSFKKFVEKYLKCKNIDINNKEEIDKMEETEEIKNELKIVNNHLEEELEDYNSPKFGIKEYIYIKQELGKNNKPKNNINLKELIQKRIKLIIDDFLKFEFTEIINKTGSNKVNIKMKDDFGEEKKFEFIKEFNQKIKTLFPDQINDNFKKITEMKKEIEDFNKFIENKKIRILFLGKISSGKTSLLNSIIGNNYNILQTTLKECTKSNFIIKYSQNISLCESRLVENQYGNYFKDIPKTSIKEIDKIIQKIKNINKDSKFEKYYTLYAPIEPIQDLKFKEDIEIIDIPGIRDDILKDDKSISNLKKLVNLCDGYIFTFADIKIEDISSQLILREILNYIKNKNESFNFNNCLFNLNYIDKTKSNEIKDKINDFKENIQKNIIKNIYNGNLMEKLKLKDKIKSTNNINISYFSNIRYEKYQKNILKIKNLKFLDKDDNDSSLENIYNDLLNEYSEIKIINFNADENKIKMKNEEIKNKIGKNISDGESLYVEKISKLILSIIEKKHQLKIYKTSYGDIFFGKFREQINNSYNNNKKLILNKFGSYLYRILLNITYIDKLCSDDTLIKVSQKNIEDKKKIINEKYDEFIEKVKNEFSEIIKYLNEIHSNISNTINITNCESINISQILKDYKIDDLIEQLKNKLNQEIIDMNSYYCEYSINQISELIKNDGQFAKINQFILNFSDNHMTNYSLFYLFYRAFRLSISFRDIKILRKKKMDLQDIFKQKENDFLYNQGEYINEIIAKKNIFITELNNLQNVSSKEINYLKRNDFNRKYREFIDFVESKK